jgi:hypothetical protein
MPRYSECRRIRRNGGDSCQQPYRADKPDENAQHGNGNQFELGVEVHIPKLMPVNTPMPNSATPVPITHHSEYFGSDQVYMTAMRSRNLKMVFMTLPLRNFLSESFSGPDTPTYEPACAQYKSALTRLLVAVLTIF